VTEYQPLGSRYFLEEPIGRGGMGVVWRGGDRVGGDVCAIKVLRPEFAADPGAVARFVRERTALVKFRHPNVVTLRDMIVEGDCLALVMDFIEGGDLSSHRRNGGGTLPAVAALRLTAQVCDALGAAHAAGIVHRDLKPANVLLDGGEARLADFGIARVAGESPATTPGMVMGTVGFMSPEVIRGEAPGPACDVYAVGVMLYELLAGEQPFTGQAVAVMHGHLDVAPPRPSGMPDRMWALISACLSKDPAARPLAARVARALRDPWLHREAMLCDQARPLPDGPYGVALRAPEGMPSGPVADSPPSGAFNPSGASSPPPSVPPSSGPVTALLSALPPRRGISPLWAATAIALVLAGGGATYLVAFSQAQGNAAGPSASRAVATSPGSAASAGITSQPASRVASPSSPAHPGTPSGRPSATVTATRAQASPEATQRPVTHAPTRTVAPPPEPSRPPAPTGPNLVADGSFTDSDLSAWNNYVTGTVVVSGGVGGGNAAMMTGPTVGVSQIVTGLKPGQSYELTGWALSKTGGRTYVGAKNYDGTGDHSSATTSDSWTELPRRFTEGAGHTTVEIYCWQADAGTGYCSDISLRALG
jgi:serine/threonine-protein kinase